MDMFVCTSDMVINVILETLREYDVPYFSTSMAYLPFSSFLSACLWRWSHGGMMSYFW